MNSANLCREKEWIVGDILEGDEYGHTARIVLTAIGERSILARCIAAGRCGVIRPHNGGEKTWTLECRDWRMVGHDHEVSGKLAVGFRSEV